MSPRADASHLWQLDAIRGAAALYIAAGHLCRAHLPGHLSLQLVFSFGQEAVMVFFLLSGFVIHWSVAPKPDLSFGRYLRQRALRIYPLFLLTLLLTGLIGVWLHSPDPRFGWDTLLGNVFMFQDFAIVKPGSFVDVYGGVSVLWSLSYEWWFYLLYFPLSRFTPMAWQPDAVALISLSQLGVHLVWPNFASRVLLYFCVWWIGVELARWQLAPSAETRKLLRRALLTVALATVALGLNAALRHPPAGLRPGVSPVLEFRHLAAALGITAVALGWHRLNWKGFRPLFGSFTVLAPVSYALYLLHEPLGVHLPWREWIPSATGRIPVVAAVVALAAIIGERVFQPSVKRRLTG